MRRLALVCWLFAGCATLAGEPVQVTAQSLDGGSYVPSPLPLGSPIVADAWAPDTRPQFLLQQSASFKGYTQLGLGNDTLNTARTDYLDLDVYYRIGLKLRGQLVTKIEYHASEGPSIYYALPKLAFQNVNTGDVSFGYQGRSVGATTGYKLSIFGQGVSMAGGVGGDVELSGGVGLAGNGKVRIASTTFLANSPCPGGSSSGVSLCAVNGKLYAVGASGTPTLLAE